nr:MAG TPA: hypothetical protein [Caudoviricetes sp.]
MAFFNSVISFMVFFLSCVPCGLLSCYVHSLQHYAHSVNRAEHEIFNKYVHSYLCSLPMCIVD